MSTIRIVAGTGRGPTAMASYDTALADAGVHNYNLVSVSSMIPAGSDIERHDTASDLGPVGERLTVVEARATVEARAGDGAASVTGSAAADDVEPADAAVATAGLGWSVTEAGRGIFYEASGVDPASVRETVTAGLAAGRDLREWSFDDEAIVIETADRIADENGSGRFVTAIVLAVYGESEPIL
ncbi:pyruvoyl-dependent arginine decarboxylase [Halococcus agarilyticus]|uniref:pyruvoyl-dependent arginine decarboxylase n=1 Tax=Halococcus agarilyticus TaxID=1232219 RepID=UPI000677B285|nr:pyruvoyl-dependent arginine decarboxylase [Halococcus agarilyticus]